MALVLKRINKKKYFPSLFLENKIKKRRENQAGFAMMKKEIGFMKKKGAPASMIKHEKAEMMGMKKGGGVKPSAMGKVKTAAPSRDGIATKGKTKGTMIKMNKGGMSC